MTEIVTFLGYNCERAGQWENALQCFRQGLAIDDLSEEFYQHLIVCHHKLGQKAEAVYVYRKCHAVLFSSLNITPSDKTEAIYSRIVGKMWAAKPGTGSL